MIPDSGSNSSRRSADEKNTIVEGGSSEILLDPATFVLDASGQSILLLTDDATATAPTPGQKPVYQLSKDITTTSTKESSVKFERVVKIEEEDDDDVPNQHCFYLVHPLNAQYRKDLPAYYITAMPGKEMIGNISFEITQPRLRRAEFKALLSAKRDAKSEPLLDQGSDGGGGGQVLWHVKPSWKGGGRYKWTDGDGRQVAVEEGRDPCKLAVTVPLKGEVRDALVAMWALRMWHDTGETRQAKREGKLSCQAPVVQSSVQLDG